MASKQAKKSRAKLAHGFLLHGSLGEAVIVPCYHLLILKHCERVYRKSDMVASVEAQCNYKVQTGDPSRGGLIAYLE